MSRDDANLKHDPTEEYCQSGANVADDTSKTTRQRNSINHAILEELRRTEITEGTTGATRKPFVYMVSNNGNDHTNESQRENDVDDYDECVRRKEKRDEERSGGSAKTTREFRATPGIDPRFQQQNQTLRCYVMYTDFYRCERILGEGHEACTWFRDVFQSVCPNDWIARWDEQRAEGRFAWPGRTLPGQHPGDRYGV